MVRLSGILSRLRARKILVIGDLILDTYTIGKARRISPEAPVPVIQVQKEENRPGGAGNVALNLKSLGADVSIISRIGNDSTSEILCSELKQENVNIHGLFTQQNYATPLKNRVIADNQQIVRVDYEQVIPLPEMLEQCIVESLPDFMCDIEAIAISDYGKGFLSKTLLNAVIELAKARNIPVITDPKGIDFTKYYGTTILKPNLSEAYLAAGLPSDVQLEIAAQKILQVAGAEVLMVTRSEAGISIFGKDGERQDFPVRVREIKDVTGAGDTVLAMLTYATANRLTISEAAQLSNIAAGIAIEHFGCARIGMPELARRLLENDSDHKIFDKSHLFALMEALKERKYILLGISGAEGMTSTIFSTVHDLVKDKDCDLVVFLRDKQPDTGFAELLACLQDVKFIITQNSHIEDLCCEVNPHLIYNIVGEETIFLNDFRNLFNASYG